MSASHRQKFKRRFQQIYQYGAKSELPMVEIQSGQHHHHKGQKRRGICHLSRYVLCILKGCWIRLILHFLIILVWDQSPRCTETDDSHHILWKTKADPGIRNTRLAILGHFTRKDHTFGHHYTLCHKWERCHKTTHNVYWNYNADCNQFTNSQVCGRESTDTK